MDKSKIDILYEYLNNNVAGRYPIANQALENNTDYIKNIYLKMLAVVLQQSQDITASQIEIFKRIVVGSKTDKTAEDYLRMALDIEIEDYLEFSKEYKELDIKYRWVLDALIITCVKEQEAEQLTLVAQFCEALEITKDELKCIATMASAIVSMDETKYVDAYEIKIDTIPGIVFSDYMYLISKKCIMSNERMTILQPIYEDDITVQVLEQINEISTPYIKIIGATIYADDYKIIFKDKEKVSLESCTFVDGYKNYISFDSCKEVMLKDCMFENFSNRALIFGNINLVVVNDCLFKNCKLDYELSGELYGSVIYSVSSVARFELINSSFIDCGINNFYTDVSGFISNINSFVDNCSFENCLITYNNENNLERGSMFNDESFATNCNYENSARFKY